MSTNQFTIQIERFLFEIVKMFKVFSQKNELLIT